MEKFQIQKQCCRCNFMEPTKTNRKEVQVKHSFPILKYYIIQIQNN